MKRVYVTGMGVISALGNGLETNLKALKEGRSGIKTIQNLDSRYRGLWPAAEIDLSNEQLLQLIPNFEQNKPYTRGQLLSLIAVNEAVKDAKLQQNEIEEMAIISANTIGGMDVTERYYRNYKPEFQYYFNRAHSSGETTRQIAHYLKTSALIATATTACSSSANALILGARLIRSGRAKRVLVGGSDPITKFSLNGFSSLLIYDEEACKPFDKNRKGLNLGEAGAYLILESEELIGQKNPYAEVLGWANRNEAFHASASTPEGDGALLTMKDALKKAKIDAKQISFVHAHGTATPNNDESELHAIKRLFSNDLPHYASSKSYVGHTLGAAGALNAIYAILSIKHEFLFKNLNCEQPIEEDYPPTNQTIRNYNNQYCMSNAFGFGGNNSSIVFAKTKKGAKHE